MNARHSKQEVKIAVGLRHQKCYLQDALLASKEGYAQEVQLREMHRKQSEVAWGTQPLRARDAEAPGAEPGKPEGGVEDLDVGKVEVGADHNKWRKRSLADTKAALIEQTKAKKRKNSERQEAC